MFTYTESVVSLHGFELTPIDTKPSAFTHGDNTYIIKLAAPVYIVLSFSESRT